MPIDSRHIPVFTLLPAERSKTVRDSLEAVPLDENKMEYGVVVLLEHACPPSPRDDSGERLLCVDLAKPLSGSACSTISG